MKPATTPSQESTLRLDTARRTAKELTSTQMHALKRVRDRGALAWCQGFGRAGGAVARMFDRMRVAGLVTKAPYEITEFGRRVLEAHDAETSRL